MTVTALSSDHVGQIVAVLSDAFADYPVMSYVLGPAPPYEARLRRLVELFVSGREPVSPDATGGLTGARAVDFGSV